MIKKSLLQNKSINNQEVCIVKEKGVYCLDNFNSSLILVVQL